jgi:hypothetical protein
MEEPSFTGDAAFFSQVFRRPLQCQWRTAILEKRSSRAFGLAALINNGFVLEVFGNAIIRCTLFASGSMVDAACGAPVRIRPALHPANSRRLQCPLKAQAGPRVSEKLHSATDHYVSSCDCLARGRPSGRAAWEASKFGGFPSANLPAVALTTASDAAIA